MECIELEVRQGELRTIQLNFPIFSKSHVQQTLTRTTEFLLRL